jgi:thiol:disulfide interchange protein
MIRITILSLVALAFLVPSSAPAQEIHWRTEYAAALKESETTNRPLFVDFYGPACIWCNRLDASTFRDANVVSTLNDKFVPLKIDGNQNAWLVQALGIQRYPTLMIAAPDGTIRATHTGYMDAAALLADLKRILDEAPVVAQSTTP